MLHPVSSLRFDVAIVGGGPAGLAAAMYLGRFLRSVVVFDAGDARASLIGRTHNCPGFPEGIAGDDLMRLLRSQAREAGAEFVNAGFEEIAQAANAFILTGTFGTLVARRVILATGVVDTAPELADLHELILSGIVRLCPVCDAYEARGKRCGVVGPEQSALKEALYLRDFTQNVILLFNDPDEISETGRHAADAAGIEIWDSVDDLVRGNGRGLEVVMADGRPAGHIDLLYASMGCEARSELAAMLGADRDGDGYVLVGQHLETSVPGLYAIGDVATALNQISVGFGHAALAATHIHNALRAGETSNIFRASA